MSHENSLLASYCCPNSALNPQYLSGMRKDNKHIGHNIRRIRELRGMKQSTLAEDLNLTQQAVSVIENRQGISRKLLFRIAAILGVNTAAVRCFDANQLLDDFARTFSSGKDEKPKVKSKISSLCQLSEDQREIARLRQRILELEEQNRRLVDRGASLINPKPKLEKPSLSDKDQSSRLEEHLPYSALGRSENRYVYSF